MTALAAFLAGAFLGAAGAWTVARSRRESEERRWGRLLSFANHELNTPATAVNMTVVNLLTGVFGDVPPDQKRWLEMTRDQVGRLNAIVGEMRDLVHLRLLRDLRPIVDEAAAGEVAEAALTGLRAGFEQAGVELRIELPKGLPVLRTDGDRVSRSLASLLYHARKFRVSGPVVLRAASEGPVVTFEVSYTGAVLAPEAAEASLDLWHPAVERRDQKLAATGLGLGLVREVVRVCGGDLALTCDPKGLTRLTLAVPVNGGA